MDELTSLVAGLLSTLHAAAPEVFPGSWAWAVSLLGIGVGLLPAAGALVVALLRRATGAASGGATGLVIAGIGLLSAGLLPYLAFLATGRIMTRVAAGNPVRGLSDRDVSSLGEAVGVPFVGDLVDPVFGSQAEYLSAGTVGRSFAVTEATLFGVLPGALVVLPLLTVVFVLVQARTALRRGPRWPSKAFWLTLLAVAFLTAGVPAWTAAHLWLGASIGAFAGMLVVPLAGTPRERAPRPARERADAGRGDSYGADPHGGGSYRGDPYRAEPRRPETRRAEPVRATPIRTPERRAAPTRPEDVGAQRATLGDRMAERFAAREAAPPVTPDPVVPPAPRGRPPTPTHIAPAGLVPVVPSAPGTGRGAAAGSGPRFRLIRRLGAGGFGKVWLAEDTRLGRTVALKAAHAPDQETEQRIEREATALRSVRHPHCVRIFDLVPASSDPGLAGLDGMVIVMEYVEGQSLGELVRARGPLDDIAAARVWASVAGALDAAHGIDVMHRDVKPGNVVVDKGGLAHLIDFGIARRSGDATLTAVGFVLGTPDFLAPEVAAGQRATPESDSWQLAATVSYALTGHPPRGGHPDAVSGLRAAASGAPLSHLPPRSAHLALLHAAMDNDPARRPTLHAARHALEDWLRRTGASPDGPVTVVTALP